MAAQIERPFDESEYFQEVIKITAQNRPFRLSLSLKMADEMQGGFLKAGFELIGEPRRGAQMDMLSASIVRACRHAEILRISTVEVDISVPEAIIFRDYLQMQILAPNAFVLAQCSQEDYKGALQKITSLLKDPV